jgi:serine/threonine protein kinase
VIGQTISHYKILDKLGERGMSVIYKAADTKLMRNIAIKIPRAASTARWRWPQGFERQAIAIAALDHPNMAGIRNRRV